MKSPRTARQTAANKMDRELFNMLQQAKDFADFSLSGCNWRYLADRLADARTLIRMEMHPKDQEGTS